MAAFPTAVDDLTTDGFEAAGGSHDRDDILI